MRVEQAPLEGCPAHSVETGTANRARSRNAVIACSPPIG